MTIGMPQRWLLAVLLTGQFMANVDIAIVNVATPSIHRDLHASGGALEFVVSGYVLAFAMLITTGARLGRIHGYRRVFMAGLAGFTVASLACGLAPDTAVLVGARIVQGAAAAMMVPQVLTGIQVNFAGQARARALGLLALTLSGGAVAGQALGGLVISANLAGTGWRPIFWINVPIGVAVLTGAALLMPGDGRGAARTRLDLRGVLMLSCAMSLLVIPLAFGREQHWAAWTWVCLACCIPAFAAFVAVERRVAARGGDPVIDTELLARPVVAWELIGYVARTSTYFAMLFVLAQYLQQGLGRSPAHSGLALVAWVAAFGIAGPTARYIPRIGSYDAVLGSLILAAAFVAVGADHAPGPFLIAALGVGGYGLGLAFISPLSRLTAAVPQHRTADVSGVFNTSAQVASVAGVAAFGTLYFALAARPGHAFAVVALALAGAACASAVCTFLAIRPGISADRGGSAEQTGIGVQLDRDRTVTYSSPQSVKPK